MPKREYIVRLEDIIERIFRIDEMIISMGNVESLAASPLYCDAMERNFEIIGEAIYQIRKLWPDVNITERDKIIALRHIIVHDYYDVDPKQLWVAATQHLPRLKTEILYYIDEEKQRLFGTKNPDLDI